jgi:hypothetical protein
MNTIIRILLALYLAFILAVATVCWAADNTALRVNDDISWPTIAQAQHGQNLVMVTHPVHHGVGLLCIGTTEEMDHGGIACHDAILLPVPKELETKQ